MSALIGLVRQLVGLYVDDGWLALGIICIVALVALLAFLMPSLSLEAGPIRWCLGTPAIIADI